MPVSDKNRKILWGKSGNRCAICKHILVLDKTQEDEESVVGEECHIVSGAKNGPRSNTEFPRAKIDNVSNLILLCRIHHKQIDDQVETFTTEIVLNIKQNHETWVEQRLQEKQPSPRIKRKRFKDKIPEKLPMVDSGKDLFNMASRASGFYFDYSDDLNDEETDTVGYFIQNIRDWSDISNDLEPIEKIKASKCLDNEIKELNLKGFLIFSAIEEQIIKGGAYEPDAFPVLHLTIVKSNDPNIA